MKTIVSVLFLIVLGGSGFGQTTNLPLIVIGKERYEGCLVERANAVQARIRHKSGIAYVALVELPKEIQLYLGYDAEKERKLSEKLEAEKKALAERNRLEKLEAEKQTALQRKRQEEIERARMEQQAAEARALAELKQQQEKEGDRLLTGRELLAWKLAKEFLQTKDGTYRDYSQCLPQVRYMEKNVTDDYVFTFHGRGKRVHYNMQLSEREALAIAKSGVPFDSSIQQPNQSIKVTVVTIGDQLRVDPVIQPIDETPKRVTVPRSSRKQ